MTNRFASSPSEVTTGLAARPRVLIVEDDEDYALFVRRMLARAGFAGATVEIAHDEATAWARLDASPYDVVVSDLDLQPGSGVRVLERARLKSPRAHRILLTSAPDRARFQLQADPGLAHGVWDKKWEVGTIRSELQSLLQPAR